MRSKELLITADRAESFAERFTEFGPAELETISKPRHDVNGKMHIDVVTQAKDLNGKNSRVLFAFEDVTMMKMKEGPNTTFLLLSGLKIEFRDGCVCVDFHAADKESDFLIQAKALRCTLESRC